MGYTHYYTMEKDIKEFPKDLIKDVEQILLFWINKGVLPKLVKEEPDNDIAEISLLNSTEIYFNGIKKDSHDPFYLNVNDLDDLDNFNFTKTARKAYDQAVCEVLILLKYHLKKSIEVSSDGLNGKGLEQEDGKWHDAFISIENEFGYKNLYENFIK